MNFNEVLAYVLDITKRPEKISEASLKINEAIGFFTSSAEFTRDLIEISIPVTTTNGIINLDLTNPTYFTRFRKFAYIKSPGAKKYLDPVTPDKVFLEGRERLDCYYLAGTNVICKVCSPQTSLLVGYFSYAPQVSPSNSAYWMLDVAPYMIINKAAASIFRDIGDDQSAKQKDSESNLQFLTIKGDMQYGFRS